ncbi:hypothetical protein W97_04945 [Coniosporium apollinis CBS 100218]|uniref:DH domain-containing protein n=1 Tax=Coniosporium apollinis (strain CBS 100218) TaxID=1168221 RepID=R7YVM7_CONA1|nr:uncharacterized protein W97_04945 [Coniosporium apollinis CBS 100218]EON65706.1 hypothetical protein W97_04945 [Coniosporium apollinis CBS 100218]
MAYYSNGQYYNTAAQPPQLPPSQYQNAYARRSPSFDDGDDASPGLNGGAADQYEYPTPERRRSSARQTDELFMGAFSTAPAQPIGSPTAAGIPYQQHTSLGRQQSVYNPQDYASTESPSSPLPYSVPARTYSTTSHLPYNPAAYRESNIAPQSASPGYPYASYPTTIAMPSPPQPYSPMTPPTAQQQFSGGRTQSYSQRANAYPSANMYQNSALSSQSSFAYSPPAPPPVPAVAGSAISPSDTWDHLPARQPSERQRYHYSRVSDSSLSPNNLPSPPMPGHGRSASHIENHTSPTFYPPSNSLPPTPGPPPPPHTVAPQRTDTLNRHPTQRALPPRPSPGSDSEPDYFNRSNGRFSPTAEALMQDDLFHQLETTLNARSPVIHVTDDESTTPVYASAGRNGDVSNGHLTPDTADQRYSTYSDESDAEAAAGVAAMAMADEQDRLDAERRESGGPSGLFSAFAPALPPTPEQNRTEGGSQSDDSYPAVDVGIYGGSFLPDFSYNGRLGTGTGSLREHVNRSDPVSSSGSRRSQKTNDTGTIYDFDTIHPFPPFRTDARVDTSGTGGLADPSTLRRRLSYDEGDETGFVDTSAPAANEPADMFFHPGMSTRRPLPPPPAGELQFNRTTSSPGPYASNSYSISTYAHGRPVFPAGPSDFTLLQSPAGSVPRSTSLLSHSSTPQIIQPMRSKTDAEERRLRQQQHRQSTVFGNDSGTEGLTPPNASAVALDLPALPAGKRFNPHKLTPNDFKRCTEPWALSSVISWLKSMTEGEQDLKQQAIVDGLVALFTHKVPTMNVADAETLSARVVNDMFKAGTLVHEEEWLKFSTATMTGVIYQLTGSGCYSPRLHDYHYPGRCYAHHCQRTLKKIDLQAQSSARQSGTWAEFYKLKKEDIEGIDGREVERQNVLHEIVTTEENYMSSIDVLRVLYRDALIKSQPPVIGPTKLKKFISAVFGKVDVVKKANEEHLLPQLKYRQQEQGPWIIGFSDIFREWIRKAKSAYIEYAAAFPYATLQIRQEAERNMLFRSFLEQARTNKMSNKLDWTTYLKEPITRLQRYGLLLDTVLKRTVKDSDEKRNLETAIEEIKQVTVECDARVAEMDRKLEITDLQSKLILRPGMQADLNLDHLGRQLIHKGDLQRQGGSRFTWLETHALLFDHYLVLAKTVQQRDVDGGVKYEKYDVSRPPIPMDLLILESTNDEPVVRSSMKGISTVTTATVRGSTPADARLGGRTTANTERPTPGPLQHTNTSSSINSQASSSASTRTLVTTTSLDSTKDDKILYPFRIKHLGKDEYTLFAPNPQVRQSWCEKIIEAKTRHAAALFAQNAEPFRLRVMADSAFAYEGGTVGQKSIIIKNTPLDRAIQDVNKMFANTARPVPICRAKVNCATTFMQPYGKQMVAVGTDFGVFVSEVDNPRGWSRVINNLKVTQVAVLEEFSLFLLISDKSLIAYHLDLICPVGGAPPSSDSSRRAPQKLSGSRDVGFFAVGRMKDRTLVFYKKRESLSSTFKVLEPVYQKSTEKRGRLLPKRGTTDFFREFDEFYIPTECTSLNLFHSSLAVSTAKGSFEVLTLDKKQPWSVPDLKAPHVAQIAARLQGQATLGMFRLSEGESGEFLCVFEDVAVYVNKHGDISRSVVMEFVGRAKSAALYGAYVLLFDADFVEVRNAQNGRLRQVIAGRDVKCLDDGAGMRKRTVKVAMQHPEVERCQIVVELVLNEGLKE